MLSLAQVIFFSGLNAIIPLAGGWIGFVGTKRWVKRAAAFTAGVLLATALFDILPSVLPYIYTKALVWFFLGLCGSYLIHLLEDRTIEIKSRSASLAVLVGSGILHNLAYGALIGVGFLTGVASAAFASIILALSDIPHEIGVFAVLAKRGRNPKQSGIIQALIAAATLVGAILAYAFQKAALRAIPFILSLLAGWFVYLAIGDLLQDIRVGDRRSWWPDIISFAIGALVVYWLVFHFGRGAFGYHPIYSTNP